MKSGKLTENWAFEIGFNRMISSDVFWSFNCDIRTKCDHQGFFFGAYYKIWGFECNIYDVRHYDKLVENTEDHNGH
jgi:hypothetical protein